MGASSCWLVSAPCSEFWHMPSRQTALATFEESNGHDQSAGHWHNSVRLRLHEDERRVGDIFSIRLQVSDVFVPGGATGHLANGCNPGTGMTDCTYSHYQPTSRHPLKSTEMVMFWGILLNILARVFFQDAYIWINLDFSFLVWYGGLVLTIRSLVQ